MTGVAPSSASWPPTSPVPPPKGITGVRVAAQARIVAATSSVSAGATTASA
jgi:hypothetical protein